MGDYSVKHGALTPMSASESWADSHSGAPFAGAFPILIANQTDEPLISPSEPRFWARQGAGHAVLITLAVAHAIAGLLGAAAAATWYFVSSQGTPAIVGVAVGVLVAIGGAVAFELASSLRPGLVLGTLLTLPCVDLLAAGTLAWMIRDHGFTVLFFVAPVSVAAIVLSRRGGFAFAAVTAAAFFDINALRETGSISSWLPETLAFAGLVVLLAVSLGAYSVQLTRAMGGIIERFQRLREQYEVQEERQQQLLQALNLLEDAQSRLGQEQIQTNQQIVDLASVARRLGEGDLSAPQSLRPGMNGPLDILAGSLARLGQQITVLLGARQQIASQQRAADALAGVVHEQAQLLLAADQSVRSLGASANELVSEVQRLQRGGDARPGTDPYPLYREIRGLEQHAMSHASNAAMLGARLAQLRARQAELEAELGQMLAGSPSSDVPDAATSAPGIATVPTPAFGDMLTRGPAA